MIISKDAEKAFDKIQHPFMIKIFQQIGTRREFPQPDKGHLQKPTANIIFNGKRLNTFPQDQEQSKDVSEHHSYCHS